MLLLDIVLFLNNYVHIKLLKTLKDLNMQINKNKIK